MTIAVDFDGTIVEHKYPAIGKEIPFATETLRTLSEEGHKLILWTSRDGELLGEDLKFCRERGLAFYAVNSNYPPGALFTNKAGRSCKVVADVYIDDRNLGGLPDWGTIHEIITGIRAEKHKAHHKRGLKSLFRR
jgi:hydroxymethylpyrimidine pyrophosphatase-like HAD family hydrolase